MTSPCRFVSHSHRSGPYLLPVTFNSRAMHTTDPPPGQDVCMLGRREYRVLSAMQLYL